MSQFTAELKALCGRRFNSKLAGVECRGYSAFVAQFPGLCRDIPDYRSINMRMTNANRR